MIRLTKKVISETRWLAVMKGWVTNGHWAVRSCYLDGFEFRGKRDTMKALVEYVRANAPAYPVTDVVVTPRYRRKLEGEIIDRDAPHLRKTQVRLDLLYGRIVGRVFRPDETSIYVVVVQEKYVRMFEQAGPVAFRGAWPDRPVTVMLGDDVVGCLMPFRVDTVDDADAQAVLEAIDKAGGDA